MSRTRTRPSLRLAIDRYCRWCIHDPRSGMGTWRQQVDGCPSADCPLYPVRPRSADARAAREEPTT